MHSIHPFMWLLAFASLLASGLHAEDLEVVYDDVGKIPVSAAAYQAAGKTIRFSLATQPAVGTDLQVIDNTGNGYITGTFDNLPHGEAVLLEHGGVTYSFIANYYAGTGNDLVLQWANKRLVGWGDNQKGQLGNTGSGKTGPGVWVDTTGVLSGKWITDVAVGAAHALALCSDGTLASWGYNYYGQLGDGTTYDNARPVLVKREGVLAGKTVIKIACGEYHSLALCSDGTLAAWGSNQSAQLGNGTTTGSSAPVAVSQSGVLAGKTIVAIAAAQFHNLVLCSDGSLASWGGNTNGKLGDGTTTARLVPVSVVQTGVLAGKSVSRIAVGSQHSLVLCSDGTLASWGSNSYGQLGISTVTSSSLPALVRTNGVLSGRTPVAISCGNVHSLALCADGFLAGWGGNGASQLGSAASSNLVPIAQPAGGALSGRSIAGIVGGKAHTVVLCKDSSVVAWGYNNYGELAHDTGFSVTSTTPLLADRITLPAGGRFVGVTSGFLSFSNIATVALPVPPAAFTLAASNITDHAAVLNGRVNAAGTQCDIKFEYGVTNQYGSTITASPASLASALNTDVSAVLTGLRTDTTYHYRVLITHSEGTTYGKDSTFRTTASATLASLVPGSGRVYPEINTHETNYHVIVPYETREFRVTPTATRPDARIRFEGNPLGSGETTPARPLAVGLNPFHFTVESANGIDTSTYSLQVTRLPESLVLGSASQAPVTIQGGAIPGGRADLILDYPPATGDSPTVINHQGTGHIDGEFDNLKQGQVVSLDHGGNTYYFIANYYGGDGNDLVLQWKNSRMMSWGNNDYGQLGLGDTTSRTIPVASSMTGALAGKTIIRLAAGDYHSIALCSDGTIASWGSNDHGQLGVGTNIASSPLPVAVDMTGVLAGKRIVSVHAAGYISGALTSDGTVAMWGSGGLYSTLGNNRTDDSRTPVLVSTDGALSGRRVVALSMGSSHVLALCSDGVMVAWGNNHYGQMGVTGPSSSPYIPGSGVPMEVNAGILAGKTILSMSSGWLHNMVRCSDGTLAGWGLNDSGQLGNNSTVNTPSPVPVDRSGVLNGREVASLLASNIMGFAHCKDGTMAMWGMLNASAVPVLFPANGSLTGKTIRSIERGAGHYYAICSDGTMSAWGYNDYGLLGNGTQTQSAIPTLVSMQSLRSGERFVTCASNTTHSMAIVASPLQVPLTLAATAISGTSATLRGSVNPNSNAVSLHFEYGLDTTYGGTLAASPPSASGAVTASPNAFLSGLAPATTYHYRLVASGPNGIMRGPDVAFTTLSDNAHLAGLGLETGILSPGFDRARTSYIATVSHETATMNLTPRVEQAGATVTVNGVAVASGSTGGGTALSVGQNVIRVLVTAEDRVTQKTYTVEVTRMPGFLRFNSARDIPLTLDRFAPRSADVRFQLGFAPVPGVVLTAVNVTGPAFIDGEFSNLAHGRRITLQYAGIDYTFVVNYFGGTGNDLVLQWADTTLMTWGYNRYGQLGNGTTANGLIPADISSASEALDGKTCTGLAAGYLHTLALCSDGSLHSWGYNLYGQLGTGNTVQSALPVRVDQSGALAGRTVVAISSGPYHNLVLCSDGAIASWGYNNYGQLGTGDGTIRKTPAMVLKTGALAGKDVVGIAAGAYHSVALCSDGAMAAWGFNDDGELGNGALDASMLPVAVDHSGALAGKTVVSIAAGQYHTLALCSDGSVVAWGYNKSNQCGIAGPTHCEKPVPVGWPASIAGKRITRIRAGGMHSLALLDDGTVHSWGGNSQGQLGTPGLLQTEVPAPVAMPDGRTGAAVSAIATGHHHSLAFFPDGAFASWGANTHGQLGNGSTTPAPSAVMGDQTAQSQGMSLMFGADGCSAMHVAVVAALPSPVIATTSLREIPANSADDDMDGISNLLEYAFGLDPQANSSGKLPGWQRVGDHLVAEFSNPAGLSEMIYGAEWSVDMSPNSWIGIQDSGSGDLHRFSVPVPTHGNRFVRLKITTP